MVNPLDTLADRYVSWVDGRMKTGKGTNLGHTQDKLWSLVDAMGVNDNADILAIMRVYDAWTDLRRSAPGTTSLQQTVDKLRELVDLMKRLSS